MTHIALVSLVITYVSTVVPWLFIIMYQQVTGGAWRTDPMGRHIMALTAVDAGIFTMLAIADLWPPLALQPWYQWAYITMVAGIPLVTAWRGVILWRLYHPPQL